jgi:hypothetical protein
LAGAANGASMGTMLDDRLGGGRYSKSISISRKEKLNKDMIIMLKEMQYYNNALQYASTYHEYDYPLGMTGMQQIPQNLDDAIFIR